MPSSTKRRSKCALQLRFGRGAGGADTLLVEPGPEFVGVLLHLLGLVEAPVAQRRHLATLDFA